MIRVTWALMGTLLLAAGIRGQAPQLTVFAAADLAPPLKHIITAFEAQPGAPSIVLVAGSTGMLAQQIRHGAPADIFFSANAAFADQLVAEHLTVHGAREVYARGLLVLATPAEKGAVLNGVTDLRRDDIRRIALANPRHAPYGQAARQALEATGLWDSLSPKLVFAENVQQAAQFVRSGSADAGIVARSMAGPDLRWVLVDRRLYAPLDQVAVVLARTPHPALASSFVDYVIRGGGRPVMEQFGFEMPGASH
jgi:molybdate transport system substrate-binding protein